MTRISFLVALCCLHVQSAELAAQISPEKVGRDLAKAAQAKPFVYTGKLTKDDARDPLLKKSPHRVHRVKLKASQYYQIDLKSRDFDPFLRLEDAGGKHLIFDDDSGGDLAARLIFALKKGGHYRIIVTAFPNGRDTGDYTLTVRQTDASAIARTKAELRIRAINVRVVELLEQGRWKDAFPLAKQVVQLARKQLGESHPLFANSLNNLAGLYESTGNYVAALPLFQNACEIHKRTHGDNHSDYARCLDNLAGLYQALGQYKLALRSRLKVKRIFKKEFGEKNPRYAICLNNLASLYHDLAQYQQAESLYQQAREIIKDKQGTDHSNYAVSLNNLASLYQDIGQFKDALSLYRQSKDIRKNTVGAKAHSYGNSLHNLAELYRIIGQYAKAIELSRQAGDIFKCTVGERNLDFAANLHNRAGMYQDMGQYEKVLPLLHRAREICKNTVGENHVLFAASLNSLAMLYQDMGQYEQALPLYRRAMDICKETVGDRHTSYGTSLHSLAELYRVMEQYEQALSLLNDAKDVYKKNPGENSAKYANIMNSLALLHKALGRYDDALPLYRRAQDIRLKVFGEKHPRYGDSLDNLAALYQVMGRYAMADQLRLKAGTIIRESLGENHTSYASNLSGHAVLYWSKGQFKKAIAAFHKSLAIQKKHFDNTFTSQTRQQRLRLLAAKRFRLHYYVGAALQANVPAAQLYDRLLQWKGMATARHSEELAALDQPELQSLVEKIRILRASLAKQHQFIPSTMTERKAWRKRFETIQQELEKKEHELADKSKPFRRFQKLRQSTVRDVQETLPNKTALVDFLFYTDYRPQKSKKGAWIAENRLLAFVLQRNRVVALVNLGKSEPIKKLIGQWRIAVIKRKRTSALVRKLSQKLWQPLEKHLQGTNKILIAPDGDLCQLPFAALPGSKPGTYLLQEKSIGYVISARQLLELKADIAPPASRGLLAIGGLNFGRKGEPGASATGASKASPIAAFGPAAKTWKHLPGTRREIEHVQKLYRKHHRDQPLQVLDGKEADAKAFLNQVVASRKRKRLAKQRWKYLHLATHGWFDPPKLLPIRQQLAGPLTFLQEHKQMTVDRHPLLRCSLVFAGANAKPDQGFLYGYEIEKLDLRGVDLVVLSACKTSLGEKTHGEGAQGLQMAFHLAGTRSQIASLWSVHDAATAVLMQEFYKNLWERKLPKLEALRQAQLTVLRDPDRVQKYNQKLFKELVKRGVPEAELTARGIGKVAVDLPSGPAQARRSPPAWWAAFVLSGDVE